MPERHERVLVRWHCAKVKGYAELKIEKPRVKTLSYDFPKLHILKPTVFVVTSIYAKVFEKRWRLQKEHATSHQGQSIKIEGASMVPVCLKFGAILTIIYKVTAFWKKWHTSFIFDRPPSCKCQSNHAGFQTYPSPEWKMADPRNFGPIRAFLIELSC